MNYKFFSILIFSFFAMNASQNPLELAAKARKRYNALNYDINHFDIDRVNEYALQLKKQCPEWLANSSSKNFDAGCALTLSEQADWAKKLADRGYPIQKMDNNTEALVGWICFCNVHGSPSKNIVEEYIDKGDSEGLAKAINYIQMSNELCVQPKEYAQNTDIEANTETEQN